MNIYLLSSVYPSLFSPRGTTPVVHYFAKEWALAGHKVHVFHTESAFPKIYYVFGRVFKTILDSKLGHLVPTQVPIEYEETRDGVSITHITIKKIKPHGRFPKKRLYEVVKVISSYIEKEGLPDCIVGHWDNPQLEVLSLLKEKFNVPTCLVFHNNSFDSLVRCYGSDLETLMNSVDLVGFRNKTSKEAYCQRFGTPSRCFIASSGISRAFVEAGERFNRQIDTINSFIYVGAFVARKYPGAIINALARSYKQEAFSVTFIGEGLLDLEEKFKEVNCNGQLVLTGRIPRDEVISYLKESDVFIMISKAELFGLVYLEAMALGCITIGSRREGIDGIIIDGYNGFLCEAGNEDELCSIIDRIRSMPKSSLLEISRRAKQTALAYSDSEVAKKYIDELINICRV